MPLTSVKRLNAAVSDRIPLYITSRRSYQSSDLHHHRTHPPGGGCLVREDSLCVGSRSTFISTASRGWWNNSGSSAPAVAPDPGLPGPLAVAVAAGRTVLRALSAAGADHMNHFPFDRQLGQQSSTPLHEVPIQITFDLAQLLEICDRWKSHRCAPSAVCQP